MAISERTIKILFAKSQNKCAYPECNTILANDENLLGEICHIRARNKGGPRHDPTLTVKEKDSLANLIVLCPTCHSLVDKDKTGAFPAEWLQQIKAEHERNGMIELTPSDSKYALALLAKHNARGKRTTKGSEITGATTTRASNGGVAVSIGGNNQGDIHIKTFAPAGVRGYAKNSIGADANFSGYIDYLCDLYGKYTSQFQDPATAWSRIGKNIKDKFRLRKRTRNDIPAERFREVVAFLQEKLAKTPVGQKHQRNGTKLCSSFSEWRTTTR